MVLTKKFFNRDALEIAPELVGKIIVRRLDDGTEISERITEVEIYRGVEDDACHASKGRTKRTEMLYAESGLLYVYRCYGVHWLMNVVTGEKEQPQCILIRCGDVHDGPAKLTKYLQVDGSFNGAKICGNDKIRIEDDGYKPKIKTATRVGIDYAERYWRNIKWRYIAEKE